MKRNLDVLVSPAFLLGLFLLLLNDYFLKAVFHNWFTGKLSDFAGLFIFPLFWTALFPRYKKSIYYITAVLFLYWKSDYSELFIGAWNDLAILPLHRTVDATDYLALLILPFSYFSFGFKPQRSTYRFAPYFLAAVSVFAFTATSYRTDLDYDKKFYFQDSKLELTRKMYHLGHLNSKYYISTCTSPLTEASNIELRIPSDFCFGEVKATIGMDEEQGQTVIALKKMEHDCPQGSDDKQKLLAIFEKEFIDKLKQVSLEASPVEAGNSSTSPAEEQLHGKGQIYFVSIGDVPDISIEELANHFRRKYGVAIKVLPKLPLTDEVRLPDFPNSRPVAVKLIEFMANKYPKIAQHPESIMIGMTQDMNVQQDNKIYRFSLDLYGHFAIIASASMNPSTFCEPANRELLEARLRKVIARMIGNT